MVPEEPENASARAADEALIKEYDGFVRSIATRVRNEFDLTTDVDDLIAWGYQGLLEARQRYDASRGVQFNTFSYYRIRGSIIDGVRKMAYLSRRAHHARKVAEAADDVLEQAAAKRAASPEAQKDVEQTVRAIDDVLGKLTASFVIASLGQDAEVEQPDAPLIARAEKERLHHALTKLPEREAIVVRGMYFEERLLDDIAKDLGISKSWASRLHTKALGMLREALSGD